MSRNNNSNNSNYIYGSPVEILGPGESIYSYEWKTIETHESFQHFPDLDLMPVKVRNKIEKEFKEGSIESAFLAVKEHLISCSCVNNENEIRLDMKFIEHIDEFGIKTKRLITKMKVKK